MNRWTKLAAKLYPRWWRERYGEEFAALLEEARPGFRGTMDILRGAIAMRASVPAAKLILGGAVLGLVSGYALSWTVQPQFRSTAVVAVSTRDSQAELIQQISQYTEQTLGRTELAELIWRHRLYPDLAQQLPTQDILERMRRDITISARVRLIEGQISPTFAIQFSYPDPLLSQKVVRDLTGSMIDQNVEARASGNAPTLELLNAPTLPSEPISPNRTNVAFAGLGAGLLASALYSWLRGRKRGPNPSIPNPPSPTPET